MGCFSTKHVHGDILDFKHKYTRDSPMITQYTMNNIDLTQEHKDTVLMSAFPCFEINSETKQLCTCNPEGLYISYRDCWLLYEKCLCGHLIKNHEHTIVSLQCAMVRHINMEITRRYTFKKKLQTDMNDITIDNCCLECDCIEYKRNMLYTFMEQCFCGCNKNKHIVTKQIK